MSSMDISASGLSAQRARLDLIANNLANADTTRTPQGGPYQRMQVSFESDPGTGEVKVAAVTPDPRNFPQVYQPGHPDADAQGYVQMPNVNPVEEMVDMIAATRAYEANITALNADKSMVRKALEIAR